MLLIRNSGIILNLFLISEGGLSMINENNLGYDARSPRSIEMYAKRLIGKSFREVRDRDTVNAVFIVDEADEAYGNERRRGGLGNLIEERFFHYRCNNDSRPDFPDAGVELKVTPYKKNKKGSLSAKERLVITMIDYHQVINEAFENSHLWAKAQNILLIYYLYNDRIQDRLDYKINYAQLFSPPDADLAIIRQDYIKIVEKIRAGKAHELSESDTIYLGASTKGANSNVRTTQPNAETLAKPRAFCFKNSYMTYVLNKYIAKGNNTYEPIIRMNIDVDFETYIMGLINENRGESLISLCNRYEIDLSNPPKNLAAIIAYKMLGITGNKAEEFVKANIVLKTIRIERNNRIKESMSFPTFKFTDLIKEKWEDSTFGNYLRETRFFFVVFKYNDNNELVLQGAQFWNIPKNGLDEVKKVWKRTVQRIRDGLIIEERNGKQYSNLPAASENEVCHVRPHGKNAMDTYPLPDGREYTKQCFWLSNRYIYDQIEDDLK